MVARDGLNGLHQLHDHLGTLTLLLANTGSRRAVHRHLVHHLSRALRLLGRRHGCSGVLGRSGGRLGGSCCARLRLRRSGIGLSSRSARGGGCGQLASLSAGGHHAGSHRLGVLRLGEAACLGDLGGAELSEACDLCLIHTASTEDLAHQLLGGLEVALAEAALVARVVQRMRRAQAIQTRLGIGNRVGAHSDDGRLQLGWRVADARRVELPRDLLRGDLLGEVVDTLDVLGGVGTCEDGVQAQVAMYAKAYR